MIVLKAIDLPKIPKWKQIRGPSDCCREDPVLEIPIVIGTYPILLSNVLNQNTTITLQPTPLAPYPSENFREPVHTPLHAPPDSIDAGAGAAAYPSAPPIAAGGDFGKFLKLKTNILGFPILFFKHLQNHRHTRKQCW